MTQDAYLAEDGTANPKKAFGALKAPFGTTPVTALIELENVMGGGAYKYGEYNFRESRIDAMTYIGAIKRHFALWEDGQDCDKESGNDHLAHIMACCALLIDSKYTGQLIDNRSKTGLVPGLLKASADRYNKFVDEFEAKQPTTTTAVPFEKPSNHPATSGGTGFLAGITIDTTPAKSRDCPCSWCKP